MAGYPSTIAGDRSITNGLLYGLKAWAEDMHALDARMRSLNNAYAGVLNTDFQAVLNAAGITGVTGQQYADIFAKFSSVLGNAGYQQLVVLADQLGDLSR